MTNTEIKPVTPADIPDLLRMLRDFAAYERLSQYFHTDESKLSDALFGLRPPIGGLIARTGGAAAGFALFSFEYRTFQAARTLFVDDVYVEEAQRGSGLGYALFRQMARVAREHGCDRMDWHVLDWNQLAIDFYHRLGAKEPKGWLPRSLDGAAFDALAR